MKIVEPREPLDGFIRVVYAANQPQYNPLPANRGLKASAPVEMEWQPSREDLTKLVNGARLRLTLLTFGEPLQPVQLEVTDPIILFPAMP